MSLFRRSSICVSGFIAAAWLTAATARASAQSNAPTTIKDQIAAVLQHGARAWNAGDLDGFLSDYDPGAGTTFVTSHGVLHGLTAIRGVYAARFASGARRDSLHFEQLEVDVLGPNVVNAIAFYVLMRGDSVTSRGPTSLVMRRTNGRWRIVHDHSS